MAYQPQYLEKENVHALDSIRGNLMVSLNHSIEHLSKLRETLLAYKDAADRSMDSNMEYADIIRKYNEPNSNSSTYGLPGVMASTVASYDIDAIRADNGKLESCKRNREMSDRQRDDYYKTAARIYSIVRQDLNDIGDYNQRLFAFIEQLNKSID